MKSIPQEEFETWCNDVGGSLAGDQECIIREPLKIVNKENRVEIRGSEAGGAYNDFITIGSSLTGSYHNTRFR